MPNSKPTVGHKISIYAFSSQAEERTALASFCALWGYWSAAETLQALQDPQYALFYAVTDSSSSPEQGSQTPTLARSWQGALLLYQGPFHSDVVYLFVCPQARRCGLGLALLQQCWQKICAAPSQESLFLEVRASNAAAIALYTQAFGMNSVSRRKNYYSDGEDALVLCKEKLREETQNQQGGCD